MQLIRNDLRAMVVGSHGPVVDMQRAVMHALEGLGVPVAMARSCFHFFRGLAKVCYKLNKPRANSRHDRVRNSILNVFRRDNQGDISAMSCFDTFVKADRNGDGVLSKAEVQNLMGCTTAQVNNFFDAFDSNRDRVLSAEEWASFWIKTKMKVVNNALVCDLTPNSQAAAARFEIHKSRFERMSETFCASTCRLCSTQSTCGFFRNINDRNIKFCSECALKYENNPPIVGYKSDCTFSSYMSQGTFCDTCKLFITRGYQGSANGSLYECFCEHCIVVENW
jgi:hypothetical protein